MTASASAWIDRLTTLLVERGYVVGASPLPGAVLATKNVRNLGPFFPCVDYVFIHDRSQGHTQQTLSELHEQARAYAESQFRLPRALRYRIPNTVTVGVSDTGFSPEELAFATASKLESQLVGGQKHSTYLFDTVTGEMYSQGLEATPGRYGTKVVSGVNPTNRMFELMRTLLREMR